MQCFPYRLPGSTVIMSVKSMGELSAIAGILLRARWFHSNIDIPGKGARRISL